MEPPSLHGGRPPLATEVVRLVSRTSPTGILTTSPDRGVVDRRNHPGDVRREQLDLLREQGGRWLTQPGACLLNPGC